LSFLGRDESQDYELVLGNVLERCERAGALVVVLKQKTIGFYPAKKLAADRFVAAAREPPAALVPASNVKTEGHSRETVHDGIVEIDTSIKPSVETPTQSLVENASFAIEQKTVVGRVELDVSRSETDQLLNLAA
jgi:hypothetical protein